MRALTVPFRLAPDAVVNQGVSDHLHRQRAGDVGDEITLAALDDVIDQPFDVVAHDPVERPHPAVREDGVDHLALAGVLRVVFTDHHGSPGF
jgi:hypothetical protein